jgi:hypothetical protein
MHWAEQKRIIIKKGVAAAAAAVSRNVISFTFIFIFLRHALMQRQALTQWAASRGRQVQTNHVAFSVQKETTTGEEENQRFQL